MFSYILTYFRQPAALAWQLEALETLGDILGGLELILVDDGSGDGMPPKLLASSSATGKLVTIKRNVAWNIPGARNWGFAVASKELCLTTDIDHRLPVKTVKQIIESPPSRGTAFTFRRRLLSGEEVSRHTDSFLLTRADYWQFGGYDERLRGHYGQNAKDFGKRLARGVELEETDLFLELNQNFSTTGQSRSTLVNRLKLPVLSALPSRRPLRLRENVEIARF